MKAGITSTVAKTTKVLASSTVTKTSRPLTTAASKPTRPVSATPAGEFNQLYQIIAFLLYLSQ